jgi:DNA polymerase II small subunit
MQGELEKITERFIMEGICLAPEALDFLIKLEKPLEVVEHIIANIKKSDNSLVVLTLDILKKYLHVTNTTITQVTPKKLRRPYAKEISPNIKVRKCVTNAACRSNVDDFIKYFRSRLQKIRQIYVRNGIQAMRISDVYTAQTEVRVIGIISDIREWKNVITFELEDEDASIRVIVTSEDLKMRMQYVTLDSVICVMGKIWNGRLYATDIVLPDIPLDRKCNGSTEKIYALVVSDTHIGSKLFLETFFRKMLDWIKNGNDNHQELVDRIKYVIFAGDLVDGVGVYPEQEKELQIRDIYMQYKKASQLIDEIPEWIEIIMIPGNHDATRPCLPAPPIFKDYAEQLYEKPNIHMLSDPVLVSIHDVLFLISHGRSLDDLLTTLPNATFSNPTKALKGILKMRHLAPIYGQKTPILPLKEDLLVIDDVPDVFVTGHVHVFDYAIYRNTSLISCSAWQDVSSYQKMIGIIPTIGKAILIDLSSPLRILTKSFA